MRESSQNLCRAQANPGRISTGYGRESSQNLCKVRARFQPESLQGTGESRQNLCRVRARIHAESLKGMGFSPYGNHRRRRRATSLPQAGVKPQAQRPNCFPLPCHPPPASPHHNSPRDHLVSWAPPCQPISVPRSLSSSRLRKRADRPPHHRLRPQRLPVTSAPPQTLAWAPTSSISIPSSATRPTRTPPRLRGHPSRIPNPPQRETHRRCPSRADVIVILELKSSPRAPTASARSRNTPSSSTTSINPPTAAESSPRSRPDPPLFHSTTSTVPSHPGSPRLLDLASRPSELGAPRRPPSLTRRPSLPPPPSLFSPGTTASTALCPPSSKPLSLYSPASPSARSPTPAPSSPRRRPPHQLRHRRRRQRTPHQHLRHLLRHRRTRLRQNSRRSQPRLRHQAPVKSPSTSCPAPALSSKSSRPCSQSITSSTARTFPPTRPASTPKPSSRTFTSSPNYYTDDNPQPPPSNHVIIFDEAQRAWDRTQNLAKFKRNYSEPEMLLKIMERHQDWAVVVALVGGGQEINSGEAGLEEWGIALSPPRQIAGPSTPRPKPCRAAPP